MHDSSALGTPQMLSISFHRGVWRNGENQIGTAFRARPPSPLRRGSETNSFQPEWSLAREEGAERADEPHSTGWSPSEHRESSPTGRHGGARVAQRIPGDSYFLRISPYGF